jgi:signal transduction histidine kinase
MVPAGESDGGWHVGAGVLAPLTAPAGSRSIPGPGKGGSTTDEIRPGERSLDELRLEVEELGASRARVVAAADDQRRRIERGLHDGPLQHLVALAVDLQLASRLADSDPAALKTILDEMGRNVQKALVDVRELAWWVYPSLLLERDLGDALRAAASAAGIPARVETRAVGECSAKIKATIYFCCVDLLQSAADTGRRATVRVRGEEEAVLFDVTVEGAAFEQWAARDLSGVSDRLGAFGGRLTVAPSRGPEQGVRISGAISQRA